jgi:hypothetical protein
MAKAVKCKAGAKIHGDPSVVFSFLEMAEQFFSGYKLLLHRGLPIDWARYFLFCHSIEVVLKAYLISRGVTTESLKRKYGHDLVKLFQACKDEGLAFRDDDVRRLSWLNEPHTEYWARYPREDWSSGGVTVVEQLESNALNVLDLVHREIRGAPMIRSWERK